MIPNRQNSGRRNTRRSRTNVALNRQVMSVRNDNFPRQFDSTIRFNHRFRYQFTNGGTFTFTRAKLLNLLAVATSATNISRIVAAVRVNQVTVYGIGVSNATTPIGFNTVSVEWLSDLGTTVIKSDTGTSIEPAKIVTGPPAMSRAAFWSRSGQVTETESVFNVSANVNNILDLDVSIVLFNDDTVVNVGVTGATTGQLYNVKVDSSIVPISYISI